MQEQYSKYAESFRLEENNSILGQGHSRTESRQEMLRNDPPTIHDARDLNLNRSVDNQASIEY